MKRDHIQSAMRNHGLVFFLVGCLTLFGIWALPQMNKDEFPQFTVRLGVVAAIYPGATAQEVEEQVTTPLEEFLLSYEEINKSRTYSYSRDGISYIFVELRESVEHKDEVWAKIRAGLNLFKLTDLPQGVLQVVVKDDFGATSSLLLAVESPERTPREVEHYAKMLCSRLRTLDATGKITLLGQQQEEIAVLIDPDRLAAYGIDQTALLARLMTEGFRTMGGTMGERAHNDKIQVVIPYRTEQQVADQVVFADPLTGNCIRLRDIATITRRYQHPSQYMDYYEGSDSGACMIVDITMTPGNNIVAYGEEIDKVFAELQGEIPPDIHFHRITDQPKVVDASVRSFLRDILLSIIVVIAVMLMLFPLKTALVAGTGVPICTAIAIGFMYMAGIELNTVTLAAMIFVLGMIVDNSVIVVDGYTNYLEQGHSRWYSAAVSTKELFMPMLISTLSISAMFFPMLGIFDGLMGEFVKYLPWTIFFALLASIGYAVWVTPYLSTRFIKRQTAEQMNFFEKGQTWFFTHLQNAYRKMLDVCFRHPWLTLGLAFALVGVGLFLLTQINLEMLPKAERDSFAVEIHLAEGSSIEETARVSDEMAQILTADPRVKSVTSFLGTGSPRFHATYQPQLPATNFAQFIVNTTSQQATEELLAEYTPKYENYFSNAYLRFKQLDYQVVRNPVEVQFKGDDLTTMSLLADSVRRYMETIPELMYVHSDYDETLSEVSVRLKEEEADRLGVTQTVLSLYLSSVFGSQTLTKVWEGDYQVPVVLYTMNKDSIDYTALGDLLIPTAVPTVWVPLRQVADIEPSWHHAQITHFNGVRTITVGADLRGSHSPQKAQDQIEAWMAENMPDMPEGVTWNFCGLDEGNKVVMPQIFAAVAAALLVMFLVMLYHFGKISLSLLSLSTAILTLFGAFLGLWLFDLNFSITAVVGIVSLIGIIIRNAIMMYEYAEQLRREQHLTVRDAAYEAGIRRMRPIFLTSATTALGVIPMIIAHTALWMPMGVVICFGTIFTLPLVVTVLPVAYWKTYSRMDKKRIQ